MSAIKIDQPIVSVSLSKPEPSRVYQQPMKRPRALDGKTYKIKHPQMDDAFYVTITNNEINGQFRPFEIFITSKNMQSYQWIAVLCRMVSALMRQPHDEFPEFVIEEMLSTFDPYGGYRMGQRWHPSLVAEIGHVLKEHWQELVAEPPPPGGAQENAERNGGHPDHKTGPSPADVPSPEEEEAFRQLERTLTGKSAVNSLQSELSRKMATAMDKTLTDMAGEDIQENPSTMQQCSKCHQFLVRFMDGCMTCVGCGDSKCA